MRQLLTNLGNQTVRAVQDWLKERRIRRAVQHETELADSFEQGYTAGLIEGVEQGVREGMNLGYQLGLQAAAQCNDSGNQLPAPDDLPNTTRWDQFRDDS